MKEQKLIVKITAKDGQFKANLEFNPPLANKEQYDKMNEEEKTLQNIVSGVSSAIMKSWEIINSNKN